MKTLANVFRGLAIFVTLAAVLIGSFAAHGKMPVDTPEGEREDYPPSIEDSAARQEAVQEAWRKLLAESGLPFEKLELVPVLNTPRILPRTLRGQISVSEKSGAFSEAEVKEALLGFIERNIGILTGDPENSSIDPKGLLLIQLLSIGGNAYRAIYRQATYPFMIENNYGELRLWVDGKGKLLNWSSTLIPQFNLPTNSAINATEIIDSLLGAQFEYSDRAGKPRVYRVTSREEIVIKEGMIVYPRREGQRLSIHLAITAEVKRDGWNVYFDAIKGQRIGVRQNFNT